MVVFQNGIAERKEYRKFKIKTIEGPDDYHSLEEVLTRRFERAKKEIKNNNTYTGFGKLPDLILMDGGKGQVKSAKKVLKTRWTNPYVIVFWFSMAAITVSTNNLSLTLFGLIVGILSWILVFPLIIYKSKNFISKKMMRTLAYFSAFVLLFFALNLLYQHFFKEILWKKR